MPDLRTGQSPIQTRPRRLYSGGRNSLLSQPMTLSVFMGSGWSQSKHWNVRFPFPSGGSAKTSGAPQSGQVGRLAWPMRYLMRQLLPGARKKQLKFWLGSGTFFEQVTAKIKLGHCDFDRPLASEIGQHRTGCGRPREAPPMRRRELVEGCAGRSNAAQRPRYDVSLAAAIGRP